VEESADDVAIRARLDRRYANIQAPPGGERGLHSPLSFEEGTTMKPNFGLSLVMGALFSTFITSIYILMSTVPALVGTAPEPSNPLGDAIVVWLLLTGLITWGMQGYQRMLEDFNKQGRRDSEQDQNGDVREDSADKGDEPK